MRRHMLRERVVVEVVLQIQNKKRARQKNKEWNLASCVKSKCKREGVGGARRVVEGSGGPAAVSIKKTQRGRPRPRGTSRLLLMMRTNTCHRPFIKIRAVRLFLNEILLRIVNGVQNLLGKFSISWAINYSFWNFRCSSYLISFEALFFRLLVIFFSSAFIRRLFAAPFERNFESLLFEMEILTCTNT